MQAIYKEHLIIGLSERWMPKDAKVLNAAWQKDMVTIWYACDPSLQKEERCFNVVVTGVNFDGNNHRYVGSCITNDFVVHVFEVLSPMQALMDAVLG